MVDALSLNYVLAFVERQLRCFDNNKTAWCFKSCLSRTLDGIKLIKLDEINYTNANMHFSCRTLLLRYDSPDAAIISAVLNKACSSRSTNPVVISLDFF